MRLLNTTTLHFEEYIGDEVPPYAILSHRWQNDEVIYQHMITNSFSNKKGFAKLQSFCHQAESKGLQYAWIDTCCIDKSSSTELSEAINSMYRWYERAAECYAYLFDVEDEIITENFTSISETSFARSEWFKRGWTLQELIAPRELFFFNRDWNLIGSKSRCAGTLSSITNIPKEVLEAKQRPGDYAVVQRMSWAAHRQTTRVEDRAYSLLGIFGVNMPLLYGEREASFIRLQHEITRTIDDMSFLLFEDDKAGTENSQIEVFAKSPSSFMPRRDFLSKKRLRSRHAHPYATRSEANDTNGQPSTNIEPLILTNSGITLNLTLVPWTLNTFLAPICFIPSKSAKAYFTRYVCIFLVRDSTETKTYRRVKCDGVPFQEILTTWTYNYSSEIAHGANWDLAVRERVSIVNPSRDAPTRGDMRWLIPLEFKGAKFTCYDEMSETDWIPLSNDVIARTTIVGPDTLVPFNKVAFELFAIIRVRRWASWWYLCYGLDLQALPVCVVTPTLPNQAILSTVEPSLMTEADLDLVLSIKECLDLTKSETFSGTIMYGKRCWNIYMGIAMWKFPPTNINPLDVKDHGAYHNFRQFDLEIKWKIENKLPITQRKTYYLDVHTFIAEGPEPEPKQLLSTRVSGLFGKLFRHR